MSRHIYIGIGVFFLFGCSMQPYKLPPNTPSARINVLKAPSAWICNSSIPPSSLVADRDGYAKIPAGKRLIVGANYFASGYNVNYSCNPRSSFVPEAGQSYYLDFEIEAERCTVLSYKEAPHHPVGLELEWSLAPGGNCLTER